MALPRLNFFSSTPKLEDLIRKPGRYADEQVSAALLKAGASYYRRTTQEFEGIHQVTDKQQKATTLAYKAVIDDLRAGKFDQPDLLLHEYLLVYDREVIAFCRNGYRSWKTLESFYMNRMALTVQTGWAKQLSPDESQRKSLFYDSYTRLCHLMLAEDFVLEKSLTGLFKTIFHGKAIDANRKKGTAKRRVQSMLQPTENDDLEKFIDLSTIPPVLMEAERKILAARYPFCFELVKMRLQGYSYKDLEPIFPKHTADQLRHKFYRCKQKMLNSLATLK